MLVISAFQTINSLSESPKLTNRIEVPIRFHEVDAMNIVWHGHYYKYFELGREALANEYGLNYLNVYEQGFMTPIVKSSCEYKKSLTYGDVAVIETTWIFNAAAKIIFHYTIYRKSDNRICASGETIQVFTDTKGKLQLIAPPFFEEWKNKLFE